MELSTYPIFGRHPATKTGLFQEVFPTVPIYHLAAKIISRSAGRSSVACAAYRAGALLSDERTGQIYDFTRKNGIEFSGIFTPKNSPDWANDREVLWNTIEAIEKRKDAQLAREIELALPHEFTPEQRRYLVQDFIKENFIRKGFVCDVAIHEPGKHGDDRNYHAHILTTFRTLDENGFSPTKDRTQNSRETLEYWRERWAEHGARYLERFGHTKEADRFRYAHKTLSEQRIEALNRGDLEYAESLDREPTIHQGPHVDAMERQGIETNIGDENRAIRERNAQREQLRNAAKALTGELSPVPQPVQPETHHEWEVSKRRVETENRTATQWNEVLDRRAEMRKSFKEAGQSITGVVSTHPATGKGSNGSHEYGTTTEITRYRLNLSQDPMRHLCGWLDENRAGWDRGFLLPTGSLTGLVGTDGMRPLRAEETEKLKQQKLEQDKSKIKEEWQEYLDDVLKSLQPRETKTEKVDNLTLKK